MKTKESRTWPELASTAAAVYALAAGLVTMLGWVLDQPRLTDWINSGISAFPNAAICSILSAIAILAIAADPVLIRLNVARTLAGIVALIGLLTLSEHLFALNFGLDTLLFNQPWGQAASAAPMRMGPPASTSFAIIGIALLLATFGTQARRLSSLAAVCPMAIAFMSIVGYWFGANQLFGVARLTGIAFQTSTMVAGLGIGLIFSIREFGVAAMIGRPDAGGFVVRRVFLPIIVFPLVLGWLRVLAQEAGLFDTAFGTAMMVLTTITMLIVLLSWTAAGVSRQSEIAAVAEQRVTQQRELLRVTLASIGDAVIATDIKGAVSFLNPVAESLTGWKQDNAVGQPLETVFRIINEETRSAVENPALRAMREGTIVGLANHTVLLSKNGGEKPIDDAGAPIRDAYGNTVGSVLIFRDITQRRLLEKEREAAARVAQQLAAVVQTSDDAIITTNFALRITSWNRAAERMFGFSAEEAVGQSIRLIIPEGRFSEEDQVMQKIERGENVEHFETERMRKDGTHVAVSLSVSPIHDSKDAVIGASKILRDITERRRLTDAESKARRSAEEASRAKDEFLAILSHELRNPLSSILGWAVLLRKGHIPIDRAGHAFEVIERNARLETQLVDSLIDLSRIAAGKLQIESERVDLTAVLQTVVDSIRPSAEEKNIILEAALPPTPIILLADMNRLQQVFSNLLTNSVKFTGKGGRIQVVCSRAANKAHVQIIDNGEGIDPDFLPQMFDRFRQGNPAKSRTQGGLGLGLAIVRELVSAHNGNVVAESGGKGQGSTFTVTLPIPAVIPEHIQEKSLDATDDKSPSVAGIRVLVVDDDADAREAIAMTLESHGAAVEMSSSSEDAWNTFRRNRPDLLIADIGMPEEDGYVLIQKVRRYEQEVSGQRLPAIALTAYASSADRDQALAVGYDVHIAKPVPPRELIRTVGRFRKAQTDL